MPKIKTDTPNKTSISNKNLRVINASIEVGWQVVWFIGKGLTALPELLCCLSIQRFRVEEAANLRTSEPLNLLTLLLLIQSFQDLIVIGKHGIGNETMHVIPVGSYHDLLI